MMATMKERTIQLEDISEVPGAEEVALVFAFLQRVGDLIVLV